MSDEMQQAPTALTAALADRYRVEREIGRGGMATVYLARDLRHDRDVAIKVLHEDLGAALGAERFLAEIKTTAKLQHPHILPLLDSGAAGSLLFYVMPFVDGETLRSRLTRERQLHLEDALRIAREVADALAYAHSHGIVHRDVKPENILLQGGHATVADFGIALAVHTAGGPRMTQTGLSLGTPQYMAPEQAMGDKAIGPAADLYALGAVTYEMLTGEPPFTGATVQAIVAKVLSERPTPPSVIRETVPAHVEAAVLKSLAKLPADRFASAAQFGEALAAVTFAADDMRHATALGARGATVGQAAAARSWRRLAIASALGAVALAFVAVRATREARLATALRQYDVILPDSAPIALLWTALDVSPAGDFAVYIAQRGDRTELWYRSLVDTTARPLPGTADASQLALSPDGASVAFVAGNRLRLASIAGDPVRELGTVRRPEGITWRSDDQVLVADLDLGLTEYDRLGGSSVQLSARTCSTPFVLSTREVLCSSLRLQLESDSAMQLTVGGARERSGIAAAITGRATEALDDEHLIYTAPDGSVIGSRWSRRTNEVRQRTVVLTGVRTEAVYGARQAAVSTSGTLVYIPGSFNGSGRLVRNNGAGPAQPLPMEPLTAGQFDVSPDGRRIAVTKVTADGIELWVHDMESGQGFQWARAASLLDPRWSPDSRRVAVRSEDPPGPPATIVLSQQQIGTPDTLRGVVVNPSHWFTERRMLAGAGGNADASLVWLDLSDAAKVRADTVKGARALQRGVVSPDGRLFAYLSADEIAVEVMGGGGRSILGRGIDPVWLDARTLVIRDLGSRWLRVRLDADASPTSPPQRWFSDPRFVDTNLRSNAITPAGEMVYLQGSGRSTSTFLRVVPRWVDQVRAAVAAAER